jgi:signal-transduction protein with cAMP-binding, CBS, and nucleotidyltransferase domain
MTDFEIRKQVMKTCDCFKELSPEQMDSVLMDASPVHFNKSETIYIKNEYASPSFYMIVSGRIDVLNEDGSTVATLESGNVIGEIGTISPRHKRTRDVVAGVDCDLLEWHVNDIEKKVPHLLEKLKDLAWLRITDWYD